MEFRMLGPIDVVVGGRSRPLPGRLQPRLLAILLDEANRVVSIDRLTYGLWDEHPPATAARQVQNLVGVLRRHIDPERERLHAVGRGFRLDVADAELDVLRCNATAIEARRLRAVGRLEASLGAFDAALAEWRGPALAGLEGRLVETIARRLDEQRLALAEERIDVALACGHRQSLIAELRGLVADHPLHQPFTSQLMLALHRSGRSPEALAAYEDVRAGLADQLGIDPDPALRSLHTAILREDPALRPPADRPAPVAASGPPSPDDPAPDDPAPAEAAPVPARLPARLAAIALSVLMIGAGLSGDARHGEAQPPPPPAALSGPFDPLWTYPALGPGSGAAATDSGLLVFDGDELRLEEHGREAWSYPLEPSSGPVVALVGGIVLVSTMNPGEEALNTGAMTALDLDSGRIAWQAWNRRPVRLAGDAIITLGCGAVAEGCVMEAVEPGFGSLLWRVELPDRSYPVRPDPQQFDGPWLPAGSDEYVLVRSLPYPNGSGDRLTVHDAATGKALSEYDFTGVEGAWAGSRLLVLHRGSTFVVDGRCEAHLEAYEAATGEPRWERFVDTPADDEGNCLPPPLEGADRVFPATLSRSATLLWQASGDIQWTVEEPASALMLIDDSFVTVDEASGELTVWDSWTHEARWSAARGEIQWARGSTLWVLDRTATGGDCGGMVGHDLATGASRCLPGSLEFITEDEVVTVEDGTWRAWPADPWA